MTRARRATRVIPDRRAIWRSPDTSARLGSSSWASARAAPWCVAPSPAARTVEAVRRLDAVLALVRQSHRERGHICEWHVRGFQLVHGHRDLQHSGATVHASVRMEGVHVRSVGCDRRRDPHVSTPRSWALLGLVALLACFSSCRDNPAGLAITPGPEAPGASDNSLALIAQLVDSAFLRPLLQRATAPGTADQLAAALAALSNSPTQDEIRTAATV